VGADSDYHINVRGHQFRKQLLRNLGAAACPSVLDENVLALHVAQFAQSLPEAFAEGERTACYVSDARHLRGLCTGGDRREDDRRGEEEQENTSTVSQLRIPPVQ
jgi:hypothetical protein